jgi:hypothetical protein
MLVRLLPSLIPDRRPTNIRPLDAARCVPPLEKDLAHAPTVNARVALTRPKSSLLLASKSMITNTSAPRPYERSVLIISISLQRTGVETIANHVTTRRTAPAPTASVPTALTNPPLLLASESCKHLFMMIEKQY